MKAGFSVFLATFVALGASWCGLVLAPTLQLGGAKVETVLNSVESYPLSRTGDATLGLQVYRANGCVACHTEQVRQTGVACEVTLTSLGVHKREDFTAFMQSLLVSRPELAPFTNAIQASLNNWSGELPKPILITSDKAVASSMTDRLKAIGIKSDLSIVATGPDIDRAGWGLRQSVAADYLYDQPVQLGSLRAGPDLANIGIRSPDVNLQLSHLYAPRSVLKDSTMPAFRYLFEVRKVGSKPSPDALKLPGEFAAAAGYEVVPTTDAKNLTAYLLSLKANVPLYEAPFTSVTVVK